MKNNLRILELCEYIEGYNDEASFRIRLKTSSKLSEYGHDIIFVHPSLKRYKSQKIRKNSKLTIIATLGILPVKYRTGGFSILDAIQKSIIALKTKYDVIHVTNGHRPAHIIPCLLAKYLRGAIIVDECWEWLGKGGYFGKRNGVTGLIVSLYDAIFEIKIKKQYDHIFAISSVLKDRFNLGEKVSVLYGGSEGDSFTRYETSQARKMINIAPERFVIGMSNVDRKDHGDNEVFLNAFTKLIKEHNHAALLVTGSDKEYIKSLIKKHGIMENIIYPGWVDYETYNKYLSACNIFVLPLARTNINMARWPNKVCDYLCLGKPILTNYHPDILKLFKTYRLGIICEHNSKGFLDCLLDIINNRDKINELSRDYLFVAENVIGFNIRVTKMNDCFLRMIAERQ